MSRALISPFGARAARTLLVAALALAGLTCRDNSPLGPGLPTRAALAIAPHFEVVAGGPVVQLHSARVQVFRMPVSAGQAPVVDTTALFTANEALTLDLTVDILGASSDFLFTIRAMDAAGNVIYAATDSQTVVAGVTPEEPEPVVLHWATADTLVRSLRVLPRDTVITANEPFTFIVIAKKADSSVVVASVGWLSRDETKLHMDQGTGIATALSQFSNIWIVATMGTGLQDSTLVSATQPVVSVVVSPPSATLFVAATQQLAAQVEAGGGVPLPTRPVYWTSSNPAVATVSATGLVTSLSVGTSTITAISGGISGTSAITVARKIPTITWTTPADITYGAALSATQLNANAVFNAASVPGTFVYNPVAGTVLNAGTALPLSVTFTPTDGAVFAGGVGATTINVLKANQAITFAALPDHVFGEADFTVSATASSALAVTFAASGACTVTGATVRLTGSGTCTITASQPGDANRNAAADVARTFNVGKAALSIALSSATGVFGGTTSLSATVTAGGAPLAGKTIAFGLNGTVVGSAVSNASGVASLASVSLAGINAGTYAGAISPPSGVAAKFAGDANFNLSESVNTLVVTQATATLALGPLTFTYDGSARPVSVTTAPAGLAVVAITYNGVATVPVNAGSYSVVASLTNQNYQAANATGTEVIGQASQTITFAALSGHLLGEPAFTVSATSTSGLAVSFDAAGSCTVAVDQVSLVAEGACTITASQAGTTNYAAAAGVSQSFSVGPRPVATVTIDPPSALVQTGQTVLFNATVKAANDEVLTGRVIDWSTGNVDVATVDNGVVTGVSPGTTTVTATVEGKSATATVEVQPPPILIDSTRIESVAGDTLFSIGARRLLVVKSFKGLAPVAGVYSWQSDNTGVVTVDSYGAATAIGNGNATIIATEVGGTADTLQMVVLQKLARIAISPEYVSLVPDQTAQMTVSGYDGLNNPMGISQQVQWGMRQWYSGVVAIDTATGIVTGMNPGNETITAWTGELEARALVEVHTLVRSVVVTGSTVFSALGQVQSYAATAYDADNKPISGVDVEWESVNESVVRPTGFDGATMSATSYINGSSTLRATVQGVHGDLPVVVSQQLRRLVVSPTSITIDAGGVAVLMAQGLDSLDRAVNLAPGQVSWISTTPAAVTVDPSTGVVTGVALGSSAVTANVSQGGNIQSPAATVTVAPLVNDISFGTQVLSIGKGQRVPITLYLNQRQNATLVVNLSVAGSNAQWATPSITLNPGDMVKVVDLLGLEAGTTTITAAEAGGSFDETVTLAVQPVASLPNIGGDQLNAGEEIPTKVYLNDPAPAGGSWVTFTFSTDGVVSVFPERAFIPAGQVAADVVIRGVTQGATTVRPVMPGVTGRETPEITVYPAIIQVRNPELVRYLGAGQFEFGAGNAYGGGEGKTFRERAAKKLQERGAAEAGDEPTRVPVRIPTGIGQWADGFSSYPCSYGGGVLVDGQGGLLLEGGYYGFAAPDYCLLVGTQPNPKLTAHLSSSDPGVALVEEEVEFDNSYAGFAVAAVSPGTATMTASANGWTPASMPVVVTTPRLQVVGGYGEGFELGDSITLRDYGGTSYYLEVGDSTGMPHPLVNSLRVRLSSSNPSVFTVNDSVNVIDAANYQTYGWLYLTAVDAGSAWLRFQSDGHIGDSVLVTVPKHGLLVPRVLVVGAGQSAQLALGTKRPETLYNFVVSATSLTDTASAAIDPDIYFESPTAYAGVRGYVPGSTDFVLTTSGFDPETVTVVVTTPRLQVDADYVGVVLGTTQMRYLDLTDSLGTSHSTILPVAVTMRSLNESIVTVTSFLESAGYGGFQLAGAGEGETQVIFEAPGSGYTPDTITVTVYREPVSFSYTNLDVGVGSTQPVYYYTSYKPLISLPNYYYGPDSIVLKVRSLTPGKTSFESSRFVIYPGNYQTQNFGVIGETPGLDTVIVEDSTGTYAPDTMYVNVKPSLIYLQSPDSVVVSVTNPYEMPSQAYLYDRDYGQVILGRPRTFSVTSSDESVVSVNTPTVEVGTGYSYVSFSLNPVSPGVARVIVSDSLGQMAPDTVFITIAGPRLTAQYTFATVGMRQKAVSVGLVSLPLSQDTNRTVFLTSSDPNIVQVPASITIPAYYGYAYFDVIGGDSIGTVRIKMETDGLGPAYMDVEVGRPRIGVYVSDANVANTSQTIEVFAMDQSGQTRQPMEPVTVTLYSSNPTVAGTDSTEVTIPTGPCYLDLCPLPASMIYRKPGQTIFTARDDRYPALIGYKPYVDTIVVSKPEMYLQALNYYYGTYVGPAQQDSLQLILQANAVSDLTVTLISSEPGVVSVPATVTIPAGTSAVYVPVYGQSLNADGAYISASADGYFGGNAYVYARTGAVELTLIDGLIAGQAGRATLRTMDPYAQYYYRGYSAVTSQQTFTLTADPAVASFYAMDGVTPITSISVDSGAYEVQFRIKPVTGGSVTFGTTGNANFDDANTVTTSAYTNAASVQVTSGLAFSPPSIDVERFGTVTWGIQSPGTLHNITFAPALGAPANVTDTDAWTSGSQARLFSTAGTFIYQCSQHPATMNGTVVVH